MSPLRDPGAGTLEDEFSRPVESIMRCDDFKSNFARRLSNRYISRSPPATAARPDPALSLQPFEDAMDATAIVTGTPQALVNSVKSNETIKQINEASKNQMASNEKCAQKSSFTSSVVRQTNMEVETLRWQLAQTEANRQMHIALLKQIVNFLNRVKEHITHQSNESPKKETLPRSLSVVHVNKNFEYSLASPKKMSTKKISKSISNVNGYKELWNQTRMTVEAAEKEATQKISAEMSRLITLATTVLGTELPDLACSCQDILKETSGLNSEMVSSNYHDKPPKTIVDHTDETAKNMRTDKANEEMKATNVNNYNSIPSLPTHIEGQETDAASIQCAQIHKPTEILALVGEAKPSITASKAIADKPNDFTAANFIEDESGFSSMSSFQEIGIPIISIISPSPCKGDGFADDISEILGEPEKWKSDIKIGKKPMKVFWV